MSVAERRPEAERPDLSPLRDMRSVKEALGKLNPDKIRSLSQKEQRIIIERVLVGVDEEYVRCRILEKERQLRPIITAVHDGLVTYEELLEIVMPKSTEPAARKPGFFQKFRH